MMAMSFQSNNENLLWGTRGTAGATIAGKLLFDDVSFKIASRQILEHISFELQPGEIVSILGPSGCGKTSLLRLAAGVSVPTSGRIALDDRDVASPTVFEAPERRNVGLMFQDFGLFPHLSVLQNVKYGLSTWRKEDADFAASAALTRVGMQAYASQYPHQLSGGEQQRVALARTIAPRPQILLMDEPFSGLDQRLRDQVRAETMALLREMRATAVLVTHDPEEAMEVSDRILLMRAGHIVQSGTPEELYNNPVDPLAATFFSDANHFIGTVYANAIETPLGRFAAAELDEGDHAEVILRPHLIGIEKANKGFEAFVKDIGFRGRFTQLKLIVDGCDQDIIANVSASDAPKKGQLARFSVSGIKQGRGVLVFKKA
jgi:iron(III) transport system ATP-binding protein